MTTKKALHVIAELGIGGAEKVAMDLGLYLRDYGYESHYIVFGNDVGEYEKILLNNGQLVFHFDSPNADYKRFYERLTFLIRENGYQVVHAHTMFNSGIVMFAARMAGVPIRIAHAHSALNEEVGIIRRAYEALMRRLVLRYSTDIVACGVAAGEKLFGKRAFEEKCQLILNGVKTSDYQFREGARQRIRQEFALDDAFLIGHVGRLVEVKNQQYLIRLIPKIKEKQPSAKLLLLGDGEDRGKLERLVASLKLESSVIMAGNVLDVPDYLSAMDVFAFPSLYEGMPLSVLEVQANGLPCVLSTGVPEDVFQTDLIRPLSLDHPEQWVQAICSAKRVNPEKYADELRQKGFDTQSVMQKFLKIYERAEKP